MVNIRAFCMVCMATIAVTAAAQTGWEEFVVAPGESVWATSTLEEALGGRTVLYPPENLFDGDRTSCWVEGAPGDGIGESVTFAVNATVDELRVVSGFARTRRLYLRNGRPRTLRIWLVPAFTAPGMVSETDHTLYMARPVAAETTVDLADTLEEQAEGFPMSPDEQSEIVQTALESFLEEFPMFTDALLRDLGYHDSRDMSGRQLAAFFRDVIAAYSMICVRVEIADVYRGTHYRDTCISEIEVTVDP
jgi:hypothetical protein